MITKHQHMQTKQRENITGSHTELTLTTAFNTFSPFQLIYGIFAQALVAEKGYDPCLLEDNFEDLKDFWQ